MLFGLNDKARIGATILIVIGLFSTLLVTSFAHVPRQRPGFENVIDAQIETIDASTEIETSSGDLALPAAPACAVPTLITGTIGQGSPDYPSTHGTITERLSQNGANSSCAVPKNT